MSEVQVTADIMNILKWFKGTPYFLTIVKKKRTITTTGKNGGRPLLI